MEPLLFSIIHSKFVSYVSEPEQQGKRFLRFAISALEGAISCKVK
jgi:hypothetical protein